LPATDRSKQIRTDPQVGLDGLFFEI